MRFLMFISMLMLASCNAPGVDVWGGESAMVSTGGYRFKVIYTRNQAHAYRTNPMLRPKARDVFSAAAQAMEQASDCQVDRSSLSGDVALVTAELIC